VDKVSLSILLARRERARGAGVVDTVCCPGVLPHHGVPGLARAAQSAQVRVEGTSGLQSHPGVDAEHAVRTGDRRVESDLGELGQVGGEPGEPGEHVLHRRQIDGGHAVLAEQQRVATQFGGHQVQVGVGERGRGCRSSPGRVSWPWAW